MVERIDIERALDDLISNEGGMKFQGLAVLLAKLRWPELIARERKNDLGLDAYASSLLSPDRIGKGLACSITPTLAKLKKDAEKAKESFNDIVSLIFATASKVTGQQAQEWADAIRDGFGFELTVMSREDIITSLQLPDNAGICRTHLGISIPYQPLIADLLQQVREASAIIATSWAAHPSLAGKPQILLNAIALDESGAETRDVVSTIGLQSLLLKGRRLVLEGPAGRGKTTTLVQLARTTSDPSGILLLVDLPLWARSGLDILEYIARQPAFRARAINTAALARLGESEPFLFLLNGWNEISEAHAVDAANALRDLERAFPKAGIIVATRAHHTLPPLPGATRLRLQALTPLQRLGYIEQAVGNSQARILQSMLSADRALDELTRNPFILSAVTNIFQSGRQIPRTKLGLLGTVVALIEQPEEHQTPLHSYPLLNRAGDYLNALADHLMGSGGVTLPEPEARAICHSVSERLRQVRQISSLPEPIEILQALSAHHILERIDYPEISFRFSHQQFQEYYSALTLRDKLKSLPSMGDTEHDNFAKTYINQPVWEEPLRMIAEDIGVSERRASVPADTAAGTQLAQMALRVDPVFAATLARLCGPSVWSHVGKAVNDRLRSWYRSPSQHHQHCALAAMIATGSPEFADVLLPLLASPDQQARLSIYRIGVEFHTSTLGQNWFEVVAQWPEHSRLEFMSELTIHQGRADVALAFARSDAAPALRIEAIRDLSWIGRQDEVSNMVLSLSDEDFEHAVAKLDMEEIPPALHVRVISFYKKKLETESDPKARIQIVMTLSALGDDQVSQLKEELTKLHSALVTGLSDHYLRLAIATVRGNDPKWVSDWAAARVIEGAFRHDHWLSPAPTLSNTLTEDLLRRVSFEQMDRGESGRIITLLAATADEFMARSVFLNLCDHRRLVSAGSPDQKYQDIDAQLWHLFHAIPLAIMVGGLLEILAQPPDPDHLPVITAAFGRMGSDQPALRTSLPVNLRQALRRYLKSAVEAILAQDDFRGEAKSSLATALAEVGDPADSVDLLRLIRADIMRVRDGRAAFTQSNRSAKAQGGMMSYSNWHVQALIRLDHAAAALELLDLLEEPEYEVEAAWGLHILAKSPPGTESVLAGRNGWPDRDYRNAAPDNHVVTTIFNEHRRAQYAGAIRGRIEALMVRSAGSNPQNHRLKELAKPLAALDAEHSANLILDIAALPAHFDGWLRLALIEMLLFAGVTLLADRILPILDPVVDQWRPHGPHSNDASLYWHLLRVLPFVDPPERGTQRIRELSAEFFLPVADKQFMVALGQTASKDGLILLRDIAVRRGTRFEHSAANWIDAVASSPHPAATATLLGFVDPDSPMRIENTSMPDYALDRLASRIADRANGDASIARRIMELCDAPEVFARLLLCKVLVRLDDPACLLVGLHLIDDKASQPVPYDLRRAVEDVVLEKKPYKGSNSFTLVPRAATDIKNRLFQLSRIDGRRSRAANDLLGQIEEWRLEYGRPSFEPRHPDYDSGEAWPPITSSSAL